MPLEDTLARRLLLLALACAPGVARAQALVVDGRNSPYVIAAPTTVDVVSVLDRGVLLVNAPLTATSDVTVRPGGLVTIDAGVFTLRLAVGGALTVERGGAIDVGGLGLPPNTTIDPVTGAVVPLSSRSGGGSHFAQGAGPSPAASFDEPSNPVAPGSGGGSGSGGRGASGGGAVLVTASSVRLDGVVRADGADAPTSACVTGGGGGSINLSTAQFHGAGTLSARGGSAFELNPCSFGGAGGLVRVAFDATSASARFDVSGGGGPGGGPGGDGGVGSAVLMDRDAGSLRVVAGDYPLRGNESHDAFEVASGAAARVLGPAAVRVPVAVPAGAILTLAAERALERLTLAPVVGGALRVVDADVTTDQSLTIAGTLVVNRRFTLSGLDTLPGASIEHDRGV